jgi:hypothetical protein
MARANSRAYVHTPPTVSDVMRTRILHLLQKLFISFASDASKPSSIYASYLLAR